jgi:hypothetical protein
MLFMAGWGGGSRWRTAVLVAGLVLLATSVAMLLAVWRLKDLGTAANIGQIVGVALAVPVLMAGLVAWWWRGRRPRAAVPGQVRSAAEVLARLVAAQWEEEAAARSLDDPDPIPVRWRLATAGLMDHPASVSVSGAVEWDGTSDEIDGLVARFRMLRRRRLVVLGGPGSGKTTLAVQMVRVLLATRQEGEPVPVLVSAAGWDALDEPNLWTWLAAQLAFGYPALTAPEYGARALRDLTADRLILPVLDGLDEIPAAAQVAVLHALNASLGTGQLILTCRTTEYTHAVNDAADVLTGAAVIEPEPLTPQAAAAYLATCLPPAPTPSWQQVLDSLRTGGATPLAETCSTPLGLWLLRVTHRQPGADPAPLADPARYPTRKALQAHLFDQLIPALIRTRPPRTDPADPFRPRKRHDPQQAIRWLGYLAHHLTHPKAPDGQPRTRDLAWWQIAAATPSSTRRTAGLAGGLVVGLVAWLATKDDVTGLWLGLGFGFAAGSWADDEPGYANLSRAGRTPLFSKLVYEIVPWLVYALFFGLVGGIISGIAHGLSLGLVDGLVYALVGGLILGTVSGIVEWAESPASSGRASSPITSWRADRTLNLLRTVAFGLSGGLVGGLAHGLLGGLAGGITLGIAIGIAIGIMLGKRHAWLGYLVATFWLARHKRLPRRLMAFLDDAHRLGLLRTVGPVYQFRHAELQDHLASAYQAQRHPVHSSSTSGDPAWRRDPAPSPGTLTKTPSDLQIPQFSEAIDKPADGPRPAVVAGTPSGIPLGPHAGRALGTHRSSVIRAGAPAPGHRGS